MPKFTLAMLLVLAAGEAAAVAARVDFAYGNVSVFGPDGREQPLVRGAELDNGDTVRTAEGRAQLRFQDGAYVSLQPNSEFAIRDYRFDGKTDGTERGFFGLAKGAMRTVSGLIGHANRDRYRITTPTATIGIRGTGGVIQVLDDGSTLIIGTSGIWSLTNAAGSIEVPARTSALAPATPDAPPQRTSQAPQSGPAPLPLPVAYAQGEERDANGNSLDLAKALAALPPEPPPVQPPPGPPPPSPLTSGPGYAAAFAFGTVDLPTLDFAASVSAQFNSSGQLVRADKGLGRVYTLGGTHADFGTDGILAWGRWIGQVTPIVGVQNYNDNQGLHYVIGTPTPVLPTSGTATYALAGATRPTYVNGTTEPGTFTGSLSVAFGATATISTVNWQVAMPDRTFLIVNTPISTPSSAFSQEGIAVQNCATCSAAIRGFFAGAGAERIGAGYQITDTSSAVPGSNVVGAAAFKMQ